MSALSPLPNAAAFAIPDFDECLRGGKLIHRGMAHLPAVPPAGQSPSEGNRASEFLTELTELTEFFNKIKVILKAVGFSFSQSH